MNVYKVIMGIFLVVLLALPSVSRPDVYAGPANSGQGVQIDCSRGSCAQQQNHQPSQESLSAGGATIGVQKGYESVWIQPYASPDDMGRSPVETSVTAGGE